MRTIQNLVGLYFNACRSLQTDKPKTKDLASITGVSERTWYTTLSDKRFLVILSLDAIKKYSYAKTEDGKNFYGSLILSVDSKLEKQSEQKKYKCFNPYQDLKSAYYEDVNRLQTRFFKPSNNSNGQIYEVADNRISQYTKPTKIKMKWLKRQTQIAVK